MLQRVVVKLSQRSFTLPPAAYLKSVSLERRHANVRGSYSAVYPGQLGDGGKVAIKYLIPSRSTRRVCFIFLEEWVYQRNNSTSSQAVMKECAFGLLIGHQHVLACVGVDNTLFPESTCIITQWMPYGNIREYVNQSTLGLQEAPRLVCCISRQSVALLTEFNS